jgi:hypothetical protein
VRALQPLQAGDEVTIAYTELRRPTSTRRQALLAGHCFRCGCARCLRSDARHSSGSADDDFGFGKDDDADDDDDEALGGAACPHRTPLLRAAATAGALLPEAAAPGAQIEAVSLWDAFFGHTSPVSTSGSSSGAQATNPRAYVATDRHPLLAPVGRIGDVTASGARCGGFLAERLTPTATPTRQRPHRAPTERTEEQGSWFAKDGIVLGKEAALVVEKDEARAYRDWQAMSPRKAAVPPEAATTWGSDATGISATDDEPSGDEAADAAAALQRWTGMVLPSVRETPEALFTIATETAAATVAVASSPPRTPAHALDSAALRELNPSPCGRCGRQRNDAAARACLEAARALRRRAARVRRQSSDDGTSGNSGSNSSGGGGVEWLGRSNTAASDSDFEETNEGRGGKEEAAAAAAVGSDEDDDEASLLKRASALQALCLPRGHWQRTKARPSQTSLVSEPSVATCLELFLYHPPPRHAYALPFLLAISNLVPLSTSKPHTEIIYSLLRCWAPLTTFFVLPPGSILYHFNPSYFTLINPFSPRSILSHFDKFYLTLINLTSTDRAGG